MDLNDLRLPKPSLVYGYVYHTVFKHPTTGKVYHYIGQRASDSVDRRYHGSGVRINNLVRKYGRKDTTSVFIVCWVSSREELDSSETHFIAHARRLFGDLCLNLLSGGRGSKHSPITRKKMCKPKDPAAVAKSVKARTGMKRTAKSRERMRLAHLGVPTGPHDRVTCPHCGKVGGDRSMVYWHFDNCPAIHGGVRVLSKRHGVNKTPHKRIECPHCGKIGSDRIMPRWHFDNCPDR